MKIILVMGLPGAGKTTLADKLAPELNAKRLNADEVRKAANDWDFSEEGRFDDTNKMFVKPEKYDFHVTTQNAEMWVNKILVELKKK